MIECAGYVISMLLIISLIIFMTWAAFTNRDPKIFMVPAVCTLLLIVFGINCHEHKTSIDKNIQCECMFCESRTHNSTYAHNSNQIIVQNNENVNIYVEDDSKVTIVEDKNWTCCGEEIESNFCPECGSSRKTK